MSSSDADPNAHAHAHGTDATSMITPTIADIADTDANPDTERSPIVRVLADRDLFYAITAFADGWPQWLLPEVRELGPPEHRLHCTLVDHAIERDSVRDLERLWRLVRESPHYAEKPELSFGRSLCTATYRGNFEIVQWLHTNVREAASFRNDELLHATVGGHDHIREWLFEHRPAAGKGFDSTAALLIIDTGRVDVLRWFDARLDLPYAGFALARSAESGRMDVLQYVDDNHGDAWDAEGLDIAFGFAPRLEIVRFVHERHPTLACTVAAMDWAAERGRLDIVQYLHTHRSEGCSTMAMDKAAENGHLDVVRFLHAHYSTVGCSIQGIYAAVHKGHTAVVKFLLAHYRERFRPDHNPLKIAASGGHLDLVIFFDTHHVSDVDSADALYIAACNGSLEIVQYLVEHRRDGCFFEALCVARAKGHDAVVEYLTPRVDPAVTFCYPTHPEHLVAGWPRCGRRDA